MTEPRKIIENFVDSMTRLMELLIKETDILNTSQYNELEPLQTRKLQLAKAYEEAQNRLQQDANVLDYLTTEERADLKALYKKFRGILSENMIFLRGSHDATERVIKLVIDAVKKERGDTLDTAPAFKARPQGYKAYARAETTGPITGHY